jgi:hypothetical protein
MTTPLSAPSLRIGFASVYAWRPHVEHIAYLARLARDAGHAAAFLACDADLPACYTRELRDVRPDWLECMLCRAGGVRSYANRDVSSMGRLSREGPALPSVLADEWAASSASTLGRFEAPDDYRGAEFRNLRARLAPSVDIAYRAARAWIRNERLDAVCVFNGRVDATRAIFEAAREAGIRAITVERSWTGEGIQLLPEENCLGLKSFHEMVTSWRDRPLTPGQARIAAAPIAARITRTNFNEWRAYNTQGVAAAWPLAGGRRRILLLPGSLNEIWGDANWRSAWPEVPDAYDALMQKLGLSAADVVLRCHPNWGENIGKRDGSRPESYYTRWARARGIHCIASTDRASTIDLIAASDAVVLASGSAALEAAAMGKQVISLAPSPYQEAGFRSDASTPQLMEQLRLHVDLPAEVVAARQDDMRRRALRFSYTTTHRLPQFVRYVRPITPVSYAYVPGADPGRFIELLRTGRIRADDESFGEHASGEDEAVGAMARGDWASLRAAPDTGVAAGERVRRRWMFQPIDFVRAKMPVGDR